MMMMLSIMRPILFSFLASEAMKKLIVELLRALVKLTDNELDDRAVDVVERELL